MRLLSYNIHKGVGNDRRYRLQRVLQVIEEENPDVICLQEVDRNVSRSCFDDQPRIFGDHFQSAGRLYQLNVPRHDGGYGNLLLSRWPLVSQQQISLRIDNRKPRGAQLAVVDSPHGHVQVVNWHLGLREHERRRQGHHLLHHEAFQANAHLPTVILGDTNDWRNKLESHIFAHHRFRQATAPLREFRSFPSFFALTALDKCFHCGRLGINQARIVRTSLARRASDHLPLVVECRVTPKPYEARPHPLL